MPDLSKIVDAVGTTVDKVQGIANTVKDISQTNVNSMQDIQANDTANQDTSLTTETPMITKSTTVTLMWIIVGFTMFLFLTAIVCFVKYNKDITNIVTQSMGYSVPVTLGCLAKRGWEHGVATKYSNNSNTPNSPSNPSSPS